MKWNQDRPDRERHKEGVGGGGFADWHIKEFYKLTPTVINSTHELHKFGITYPLIQRGVQT